MNPRAASSTNFLQRRRLILGVAAVLTFFFASRDYLDRLARGVKVTPGKDI